MTYMFSKILKSILRHKFLALIVLLVIAIGGNFVYKRLSGDKNTAQYVTAVVKKGTLVVSVSGSGQVSVSDQKNIKPDVSGDITKLYIQKDQQVEAGQLLAVLDSKDAQRAVSDAEIVLESAEIKLEELLSPPDAQDLLSAENDLAQAERDLEKAEKNWQNIEADAETVIANAYEDGYSDVSVTFFKLSDYMQNLESVEEYADDYKLILGADSLFVERFLDDYYQAEDLFDENFIFFRGVYRDDDRNVVYQLIENTFETTKAISQAMESIRHMFDTIVATSYEQFSVASNIETMMPKIESDLSSVVSSIRSLQQTINTIDDTVQDTPDNIKDAELVFKSAQEKLEEKKLALEELKSGADSLDIRTEQNIVAQKQASLADAKEQLDSHFIRAPFAGVIAEIEAKAGESISPNDVLASLIGEQEIAEITLNEIDAANIRVDQKATLAFDALPDVSITGRVLEVDVVGQVSQGVVSYGVEIAFDTDVEDVKPGMSVTVDIITEAKQDVLVLPSSAIKIQGNSYYVELVEVDEAFGQRLSANVSRAMLPKSSKPQSVEVGLSNDLFSEIISGLKEGDIVVAQTINSSASQSQFQQSTGGGAGSMQGMMRIMH